MDLSRNKNSVITGWGVCLPKKVVTNDDLSVRLNTNHDWIMERTGIAQRHVASVEETTSFLGLQAARQAICQAGIDSQHELDMIICATTTPDLAFPAVAVMLQAGLSLTRPIPAFDVQAVCTGFIYALYIADSFIQSSCMRHILIVGSENMSRLLDWNDRRTCILFGDGAGAVILSSKEKSPNKKINKRNAGIIFTSVFADGRHAKKLHTSSNISCSNSNTDFPYCTVLMDGKEVFRYAVKHMISAIEHVFLETGLSAKDVDWFIPHQANKRIIESLALYLDISLEKFIITIEHHANTSAASIPMALATSAQENVFSTGDVIVLVAMGAGFTWGASAMRWGV